MVFTSEHPCIEIILYNVLSIHGWSEVKPVENNDVIYEQSLRDQLNSHHDHLKVGHQGVARWTRSTDIFNFDLLLVIFTMIYLHSYLLPP